MHKILVSSCLVGLPIRYNGRDKPTNAEIVSRWRNEDRLVHICPEVSAGFNTPRPPAEITNGDGVDVLSEAAMVIEATEADVTKLYIHGAEMALQLAVRHNVKVALLTDGSPSCGSSYIYDGSFTGKKKKGIGVTTALLEKNGIKVFPDSQIEDADEYLRRAENST
ncbi:DUF523 domain-containing protein [Desulfonatronum sp. SC1]|uniref:DUF523 domain-containing protein n=1 Tax=Desulfonatronum sp. SC1 TaxID=2109626 RepID=UPI000D30E803|nr:DUF523 domain-containing protein [Desulfonatronum sp. SC1]PTN36134.1 DUF523 domain-containing protein [Desulfonatronum sp. SC1]